MKLTDSQQIRLKGLVFASLANAVENGYEDEMMDPPAETVAIETLDYDSDVEEFAEEVSPEDHCALIENVSELIEEWRRLRS